MQDCPEGAYCVGSVVWSTWWPSLDFGACPDLRSSSEPVCCPRRVSVRPTPICTIAISTGIGRTPRIWRVSLVECEWAARGMSREMGIQTKMRRFHLPPLQHLSHRFQAQRTGRLHRVSRGRYQSCAAGTWHSCCLLGAAFIVYLSIQKEGAVVEVSEASRRSELPSSRQYCRPLPHEVARSRQSFFEAQAAISSASKSLLSPACELTYLRAAQAFYQIKLDSPFCLS